MAERAWKWLEESSTVDALPNATTSGDRMGTDRQLVQPAAVMSLLVSVIVVAQNFKVSCQSQRPTQNGLLSWEGPSSKRIRRAQAFNCSRHSVLTRIGRVQPVSITLQRLSLVARYQ